MEATVESAAEILPAKKKHGGRPFSKGSDDRRRQEKEPAVRKVGPGKGLLKVMRTVLLNKAAQDVGEEEKAVRTWLKDEPERFLKEKHRLEEEEGEERAGTAKKKGELGGDEEGMRELISDLLVEVRRAKC